MARAFLTACLQETKRIFSDSRIFTVLIGGPLLYVFLFGGVYWQGRTRYVPVVIVDQDHSALSRAFISAMRGSDSIRIVGFANSPSELVTIARREEAYGCVMFPLHFERDVLAGRSPKVAVLVDGSNNLLAGTVISAVRNIAATFGAGIDQSALEESGVPADGSPSLSANATAGSSAIVARPITFAERPLFDPTGSYSYFILIGLACAALQGSIRMAISVSIGVDRCDQVSRDSKSPNLSMPWLFASKVIGASLIALPLTYVAVASVFWVFGTPHRGSLFLVFAACAIYGVLQICMGYGYFGLCKSPLFALHIHMYMSSVLFILSGFTWPYYAMTPGMRALAYCLPIFPMNCIMRKATLVGAQASWLLPHFAALAVWLVIAYGWGYAAFKQWFRTQPAASEPES